MGINCKLFIGIKEDSEIRMFLAKSIVWQEDRACGLAELKEVTFDKSVYIGRYIPSYLTLSELKEQEKWIKNQLQHYFPQVKWDHHTCTIFSEVFIL